MTLAITWLPENPRYAATFATIQIEEGKEVPFCGAPTLFPMNPWLEKALRVFAYTAGPLMLFGPWVWLAVRTKEFLRTVTGNSTPFTKQKIWLAKTLGLIVGGGAVFALASSLASSLGIPMFLGLLPAGIVVYFAIKEDLQEVVPPKPLQLQYGSAYQSSWLELWALYRALKRSWLAFAAALSLIILLAVARSKLPDIIVVVFIIVDLTAVGGSMGVIAYNQWRFLTWPCPRCGCSFQGFWKGKIGLADVCAHCGLPREDESSVPGGFPSDSNQRA